MGICISSLDEIPDFTIDKFFHHGHAYNVLDKYNIAEKDYQDNFTTANNLKN